MKCWNYNLESQTFLSSSIFNIQYEVQQQKPMKWSSLHTIPELTWSPVAVCISYLFVMQSECSGAWFTCIWRSGAVSLSFLAIKLIIINTSWNFNLALFVTCNQRLTLPFSSWPFFRTALYFRKQQLWYNLDGEDCQTFDPSYYECVQSQSVFPQPQCHLKITEGEVASPEVKRPSRESVD